jgi:hypothetical protein
VGLPEPHARGDQGRATQGLGGALAIREIAARLAEYELRARLEGGRHGLPEHRMEDHGCGFGAPGRSQ